MIQEIAPKKFDNAYHAKSPKPDDFVLVFRGHGKPDDRILCRIEDGKIVLPTYSELGCEKHLLQYLFSIDETCYFLYMPGDLSAGLFISDIFSFSYEPIRSLRRNDPVYTCFAGMTGYHLYVWYRDNVFCGRCGAKTVHDKKGADEEVPALWKFDFSKIAPAVIIGLIHEDSILISTYAGRPYKGRALLAGFCEIGETPEQTVVREVQEEVGLRVKIFVILTAGRGDLIRIFYLVITAKWMAVLRLQWTKRNLQRHALLSGIKLKKIKIF